MDQLDSNVSTSNFSSSPGLLPHPNWYSSRLVPAVVLSICFILGVPGNIAVIILRPNWQHLSSLSQSLMLNLAASDLICLMTLPIWIHAYFNSWIFGLVTCELVTYVGYCTIYCSQLTVTGLSIQRYLLVVHQQSCHQIQIGLLLVLLWLVPVILSSPVLVVQQLVTDQQWIKCRSQYFSDAQEVAILMAEVLVGIFSLSIVVLSYIGLQRKISQDAFFNNPQTTRLITSIIVSFFVLWVPYLVINVLIVTAVTLHHQTLLKFSTDAWYIAAAATFVNRCLNPLLYAFTSCSFCTFCLKTNPTQQNQRTTQTPDITTTVDL